METQGLSKNQMLSILGYLSEDQLRKILEKINFNSDEDTMLNQNSNYSVDSQYSDDYDNSSDDYFKTEEMQAIQNMAQRSKASEVESVISSWVQSNNTTLALEAFSSRYVEICEYLLKYEFNSDLKEELRLLSAGLYELYQRVDDPLAQYKIVLYQKYINKIYDEERVSINPYSEIASEISYYFLDEAMNQEWFKKYVGLRTLGEFEKKKYDDSELLKGKRQRLLSPINVDSRRVDDYLKILKDYAFNISRIITTNDGDRAVFNVTDKICKSFLNHEDNDGYLAEGLKYYLNDMKNYKKSL